MCKLFKHTERDASLYEDFNYKLVIDSDMREIKRNKKRERN